MSYNFDEIIDRRGTNSIKYDFTQERGKPKDIIPLWVADMDFRTPPEVTDALIKAVEHGVFGYSESKQEYFDAVYHWFNTRFDWKIKLDWLVKTPGVVFSIAAAIRAFTDERDSVMIQQPVYYPFFETIMYNNRRLINNSLVYQDGSYHIDFEDFEAKIIENNVKLFIFCSPHNPVGRVWTKDELILLGDICVKHGVTVVSDEIHADFIYEGHKHYIFSSLKSEYLKNTIICTAPSKTFNLAGLQISNIIISDEALRKKFKKELKKTGYSQVNSLGIIACQAAYNYGDHWLDDLKKYLADNLSFVRYFLNNKLPQIKLVEPQGTYLVWLDFKALNLSDKDLEDLIENEAKLWLDKGTMFGPEGEGFQRVNIACPRGVLEKAFCQLEKAILSHANTTQFPLG